MQKSLFIIVLLLLQNFIIITITKQIKITWKQIFVKTLLIFFLHLSILLVNCSCTQFNRRV